MTHVVTHRSTPLATIFLSVVGLHAKVVQAWRGAPRGDGEVDARVLQHPLGIVRLLPRGGGSKQLGIEDDALGQIIDMHMGVEAFHGVLLGATVRNGQQ